MYLYPLKLVQPSNMRIRPNSIPVSIILVLSEDIIGEGGYIFEKISALTVNNGKIKEVVTDQGSIMADKSILVTHTPVYDPNLLNKHLYSARSYVLGLYTKGNFPDGMFIDYNPLHTNRPIPIIQG